MTMFDERERAFENLFAHEEELRFLSRARRNQLFARWAGEQLGFRGAHLEAYVRTFAARAADADCDRTLVAEVQEDFLSEGVETSQDRIRAAFDMAAAEAERQVRAEPLPSLVPGSAHGPTLAQA